MRRGFKGYRHLVWSAPAVLYLFALTIYPLSRGFRQQVRLWGTA